MKTGKWKLNTLIYIAVLAAMVYVITIFRFPLMGSQVHFANAVCLLAGMLLGPVPGGIAAGLGSALYDVFGSGRDIIEALITFVSKFAMAYVCGLLMNVSGSRRDKIDRTVFCAIAGALTYIALYMLKTYVYQRLVYGYPLKSVGLTMWSKLIPSLINALVAVVAAPIFYHTVKPALKGLGLLKINETK